METCVIVQARMGSTRLPGKVLLRLGEGTVLQQVVQRVRAARQPDGLVVATSDLPADDAIVAECRRLSVPVFRGSESDVLSRYAGAARQAGARTVVRVTSDCPLLDPAVLDEVLAAWKETRRASRRLDYTGNTLDRRWPRGLDVEVFTAEALYHADREAVDPEEREHVTPFLYRRPERFRITQHLQAVDQSGLRWTLDTPDDYAMIQAVYEALGPQGQLFTTQAVLAFLAAHPEVAALNAHVEQKQVVRARRHDTE